MRRRYQPMTTWLVIVAITLAPCSAIGSDYYASDYGMSGPNEFEDPQTKTAEMATDAILARPLGLVSTILGFGLFVVSSPFSALGGNTDEAWHTLVARPAKFTFVRPLGDFEDY